MLDEIAEPALGTGKDEISRHVKGLKRSLVGE